MRHHIKHLVPCVAMLAAIIALRVTGIGAETAWLPALVLLACPAMMLTMMWGMHKPTATDQSDAQQPATPGAPVA